MHIEKSNKSVLQKKCLLMAAIFFALGAAMVVIGFNMPGHEIHSVAEFHNGMWDRLTSFSKPRDWFIGCAVLLHALAFICFIAGMPPKKN